jgi:TldD protein
MGWERISESGLTKAIPRLMDEARASRYLREPDTGRFDVVMSAQAVASIASVTLGEATELDRALGYEANAEGTSYLDEPLAMLGAEQVGSALLTVTANRSVPGGLGTVKWDDEAVEPDTFTLIRDGILTDFQTTREQVAWLAPYYAKTNQPARSHGCASAESALYPTMQLAPNLQVMPGAEDVDEAALIAGTRKGFYLEWIPTKTLRMDQQVLNGSHNTGFLREIVNGKLGRYVKVAGLAIRAPAFWKNLAVLGGPKTVGWYDMEHVKGEPQQTWLSTVGAVPAKFTNIAIFDPRRR